VLVAPTSFPDFGRGYQLRAFLTFIYLLSSSAESLMLLSIRPVDGNLFKGSTIPKFMKFAITITPPWFQVSCEVMSTCILTRLGLVAEQYCMFNVLCNIKIS
jgi:hypothetical protein